jgi:hypothetical protein
MEDEEHEVYGQEIPVDGEDVDMSGAGDEAAKVPPGGPVSCCHFSVTLTLAAVLTSSPAGAAAGTRRDEAPPQGDGGGGRRAPRDAGQGRQGDARFGSLTVCSRNIDKFASVVVPFAAVMQAKAKQGDAGQDNFCAVLQLLMGCSQLLADGVRI